MRTEKCRHRAGHTRACIDCPEGDMKTDSHGLKMTASLLLALSLAGEASAQSAGYPAWPVRLSSGSARGSAVDVGLRMIADGLSTHWNQQVVVVNQPGAGG